MTSDRRSREATNSPLGSCYDGRTRRDPAIFSNIRNRKLVDLVPVCINNMDKPATPVPSLHDGTVLEITCQNQRIITSGGIARQINALVIFQDLLAIGQMEMVARHCEWLLLKSSLITSTTI